MSRLITLTNIGLHRDVDIVLQHFGSNFVRRCFFASKFKPSRHQDVATDWHFGDSVFVSNPGIFLIDERKLHANGFQGGHQGLCKSHLVKSTLTNTS